MCISARGLPICIIIQEKSSIDPQINFHLNTLPVTTLTFPYVLSGKSDTNVNIVRVTLPQSSAWTQVMLDMQTSWIRSLWPTAWESSIVIDLFLCTSMCLCVRPCSKKWLSPV